MRLWNPPTLMGLITGKPSWPELAEKCEKCEGCPGTSTPGTIVGGRFSKGLHARTPGPNETGIEWERNVFPATIKSQDRPPPRSPPEPKHERDRTRMHKHPATETQGGRGPKSGSPSRETWGKEDAVASLIQEPSQQTLEPPHEPLPRR